MNPYLQIAREHLTTEELEMLIEERERPGRPKGMTKDEEQRADFRKRLQKLI